MITYRRFSVVLLLTVATLRPTTAEAGPLLDWLFHRNRSQTIGGYSANAGATVAVGQPTRACCLSNLCCKGRNAGYARSAQPIAPANTYAAAPTNVYPQTAGYAPQGGCSSGWCQQTVVRWIPQTAYRTAYQQVPVTTYKTSTTINPANGLPLTCTRPCTTYTAQARRVPYTTYRPIYTTVPVTDPLSQRQPTTVGYAPANPPPNYALQPPVSLPYAAPSGCTNCQNGGLPAGYANYGNTSNVPGYTPGNATSLPPALAPRPWSTPTTNGSATTNAPNATPWQSVPPSSSDPYANGNPAPRESPAGATDWQPLGPNGTTQPPSSNGGNAPADETPRLNRPVYPEGYEDNSSAQEQTTMPDYLQRRISGSSQSQLVPREPASASYQNDNRSGDDAFGRNSYDRDAYDRAYDRDRYRSQPPMDDPYQSPREDDYAGSLSAPGLILPPSNQVDTQSSQPGPIQGIPDRRRASDGLQSDLQYDDKTAGRPAGTRPIIEATTQARYAAAPIKWESRASRTRDDSTFDWRKQASRPRESRPASAWTPIR